MTYNSASNDNLNYPAHVCCLVVTYVYICAFTCDKKNPVIIEQAIIAWKRNFLHCATALHIIGLFNASYMMWRHDYDLCKLQKQ